MKFLHHLAILFLVIFLSNITSTSGEDKNPDLNDMTPEQIAEVDIDGDGVVTGNEARFTKIDADVNGFIDPDELMDFVIELLDDPGAPDIAEDDVTSVLHLIDTDNDNQISYSEFVEAYNKDLIPLDEEDEEGTDMNVEIESSQHAPQVAE